MATGSWAEPLTAKEKKSVDKKLQFEFQIVKMPKEIPRTRKV